MKTHMWHFTINFRLISYHISAGGRASPFTTRCTFQMSGEPNWAPLLLITLSQRCRTRENSAEQQHCGFLACCYSFPFSWVTCPNSYSIILWVFCPISGFFALVLCGFFAYISGFYAFICGFLAF